MRTVKSRESVLHIGKQGENNAVQAQDAKIKELEAKV